MMRWHSKYMQTQAKKIKKNGYMIAASVIIALSASLRLFFISHNWPSTNSDEGTVGLMALHIAHFKDFPVYLYGQGTLGSLEAYVGVLMFPLFGPTVFALRVGVLLLFVLFLISMYLLTSLLYTRRLALLTLALLSLGSSELLFREYLALAGHAETPLFDALLVLLASKLALSSPASDGSPVTLWRLVAYGLWGCLVGAAFWNDPLTMPFALTSGIFLLVFCRHELRYPVLLSILIGLLVGLFPIIMYNFTVPNLDKSSLSAIGFLFNYDNPIASDSIFARLGASFLVTLPVSTGAIPLCAMTAQNAWPLSPQILQCTAIHGTWALALVILWLLGVVLAIRLLRPLWSFIPIKFAAFEKRRDAIIQGARLMLLASALLTFLTFAISVQSITGPWSHHRYLIALAVATPAVLWPLWRTFSSISTLHWSRALPIKLLCLALIIFYAATMTVGTLQATEQIPRAETFIQSREALVSALLHLHITHIYTDYWTCDMVAFQSGEQIICSVVDEQLQPGLDRYLPYRTIVQADPHPAYVFPTTSPQATAFASKVAQSGEQYRRFVFDGYVVYQS